MGDKSLQKKQYIIDVSKNVFCERGFATVTMKDIVLACDISRGGVYLYFDSVKALFEEIINQEISNNSSDIDTKVNLTNSDILKLYLKEQKKEILQTKGSLVTAIYEYCFANKKENTKSITDNQYIKTVLFLEGLFKAGNESGEFEVSEPRKVARNMAYAFEGLKILSRSGTVSEKMVDDEISFLLMDIL